MRDLQQLGIEVTTCSQKMRMRTILCFAKDPRAEAGMRELIGDAEARLTVLEARRPTRR
jgi:hypothetical protein